MEVNEQLSMPYFLNNQTHTQPSFVLDKVRLKMMSKNFINRIHCMK
jgi:hypothetical protein